MTSAVPRVALVTGASSGIGAAIARALVRDLDMYVCVCARRVDRLNALAAELHSPAPSAVSALSSSSSVSMPARVHVIECDVSQKESIDACVSATLARFSRIDVLVNCAGIMLLSMVDKLWTDEWMRMVDVNIKGVMLCTAAVLPHMRERRSGFIVNISSDADRKVFPGSAVYSATKAAVTAFSEGCRNELAKDGIRITSVSPGAVATELGSHIRDEDVLRGFAASPLAEFLEPEDVARAVVFCLAAPPRMDVNNIMLRPTAQTS